MTIHSSHQTSPAAPIADERLLLTKSQAAASLSISKRTLDRLISAGTFPRPMRIGRASRVARADIAGYLEKLRRERGDKLGTS